MIKYNSGYQNSYRYYSVVQKIFAKVDTVPINDWKANRKSYLNSIATSIVLHGGTIPFDETTWYFAIPYEGTYFGVYLSFKEYTGRKLCEWNKFEFNKNPFNNIETVYPNILFFLEDYF